MNRSETRTVIRRSANALALLALCFLAACEDEGNPGNDNLLTGGSVVVVIIILVVIFLLVRRRRG